VCAIEPQRVLYHLLCGNVALNLYHNVVALNVGLGATAGRLPMPAIDYARGGNFGGIGMGQWDGEEVPIMPLDSYAFKACHLIKVDVEGMERDVLEGARATLLRHRPLLYVENDRQENSKALIDWLLTADYRLFWHLPALFNRANYFGREENIFGTVRSVNMLCIPRSSRVTITNFREILSPDDDWRRRGAP
jgi:FkbM family methyltransferase